MKQKQQPQPKDSQMLKDALEFVRERFSKAEAARLVSIPGDGRKAYVDQGGTLTVHEVPPAVRNHHVKSVEDLIAAAEKWNTSPVVWIDSGAIVLLPDDGDRRDRITLSLIHSPAFQKLSSLEGTPVLDQLQLIRVLRVDLQGTINRASLLTAVRNIKFRQSSSGAASIQQGSESLGRTIEAEVSGAGDIPESVVVSVPVYANHGEREKTATVMCDLEIVPSEQKFRFRPCPDELERVTDAALADIRERIVGALEGVAVFYGNP